MLLLRLELGAYYLRTGLHCSLPFSVVLNYLLYCNIASNLGLYVEGDES